MEYLHSLELVNDKILVNTTSGRSFIITKSFLQSLLAVQANFQTYALVQLESEEIKFSYSSTRARFTTDHGVFEFDRPTFSKMLKCFESGKTTIFGETNNCENCQ